MELATRRITEEDGWIILFSIAIILAWTLFVHAYVSYMNDYRLPLDPSREKKPSVYPVN